MLKELHLRHFVIIRKASLSFSPGLTVFTGETGAGKSILVQALKLLLGGRAPAGIISPGAKEARVEAIFELEPETASRLKQADIPVEEELYVRRLITEGRSRAYINETPVPLGRLTEIIAPLVAISGQHEFQRLFSPEDQLDILDTYADLKRELQKYQSLFASWKKTVRELADLKQRGQERERELDYLRFQIREIETASLKPGEDEELLEQRRRLKVLGRLQNLSAQAHQLLYADKRAIIETLAELKRILHDLSQLDEAVRPLAEAAEGLYFQAEDLALEVRGYLQGLPEDALGLEEIEDRLAQIESLKRKYGPRLEDVFETLKKAKERLSELEALELNLPLLEKKLKTLREDLDREAEKLHQARQTAAEKLSQRVSTELSSLGMPPGSFQIMVKKTDPGPMGADQVEFFIQANPDLPPRPLSRVASGGELSRIFLALKVVLAEAGTPAVLLFDEVDTGIGGVVAQAVGERLKRLSRIHQVLTITHLPQIASFADHHFLVSKKATSEGTITTISPLQPEERLLEMARMLGRPLEKEALEFAKKLIAEAQDV